MAHSLVTGRDYVLARPRAGSSFTPGQIVRYVEDGWAGDEQVIVRGRTAEYGDRSEYADAAALTVPAPSSPADVTNLAEFQALVVARSYERQTRHSLCGEVQRFLTDDLGLGGILPHQEVTLTLRVVVPQGPNANFGATIAAEQVRETLIAANINVGSVTHEVPYEDAPEPEDEDPDPDDGECTGTCCVDSYGNRY